MTFHTLATYAHTRVLLGTHDSAMDAVAQAVRFAASGWQDAETCVMDGGVLVWASGGMPERVWVQANLFEAVA